jgi:hypothetical protein
MPYVSGGRESVRYRTFAQRWSNISMRCIIHAAVHGSGWSEVVDSALGEGSPSTEGCARPLASLLSEVVDIRENGVFWCYCAGCIVGGRRKVEDKVTRAEMRRTRCSRTVRYDKNQVETLQYCLDPTRVPKAKCLLCNRGKRMLEECHRSRRCGVRELEMAPSSGSEDGFYRFHMDPSPSALPCMRRVCGLPNSRLRGFPAG